MSESGLLDVQAPVAPIRPFSESLLNELNTTIGHARADGHHSTVVQALTLSAKLVGLLRERVEIGGPGSFDACEDMAGVVDKLLEAMTTEEALETADEIRRLVLERAADAAIPVEPSAPGRKVDEVRASVELYRPRR